MKDSVEKTDEMKKYEIETGKNAVWHGEATEGFKKWLKRKKGNSNHKERVTILISKDTRNKWENFTDRRNYNTISNLVRKAVNIYIDSENLILLLKDINKLSHKLKEPLTAIKGFSQLIINNYSNNLDLNILLNIKEIYNQSKLLEMEINKIFSKMDMEPKKQNYDILIVDDDLPTLKVLTEHFKLNGKTCKCVRSASSCIEELKYSYPKLILIDVILPDIDGFELCKMIKSEKELKHIPIFYVSAIPDKEISKRIEDTEAEGYILKPFDLAEFDVLFQYL